MDYYQNTSMSLIQALIKNKKEQVQHAEKFIAEHIEKIDEFNNVTLAEHNAKLDEVSKIQKRLDELKRDTKVDNLEISILTTLEGIDKSIKGMEPRIKVIEDVIKGIPLFQTTAEKFESQMREIVISGIREWTGLSYTHKFDFPKVGQPLSVPPGAAIVSQMSSLASTLASESIIPKTSSPTETLPDFEASTLASESIIPKTSSPTETLPDLEASTLASESIIPKTSSPTETLPDFEASTLDLEVPIEQQNTLKRGPPGELIRLDEPKSPKTVDSVPSEKTVDSVPSEKTALDQSVLFGSSAIPPTLLESVIPEKEDSEEF